jgi:hypothetical protein
MPPSMPRSTALALVFGSLVACRSARREGSVVGAASASSDAAEQVAGETTGRESGAGAAGSISAESKGGVAAPQEDVAEDRPPARWVRGSLDTRVVARSTSGDRDFDVFEVLSLDFGSEGGRGWTGHFDGRIAWDADGASPSFPSLADAEGDALDGQIYTAYARRAEIGPMAEVVLGRQLLYDTPVVVWLDGVAGRTAPRGSRSWITGVYGGVPVHAYEASSSGDVVFGLFEEVEALERLRLRADWVHLEDERSGFEGTDDLYALSAQYDPSEALRLEAEHTRVDSEARDVTVAASWSLPEEQVSLQGTWYRLLEPQRARVLELDPFFDQLLTLEPYEQARLVASKDFGATVHLDGGLDVRRVLDEADVGPFNHDFERWFATATFDALLPAELVLALTGEVWDGDDTGLETWGADLSRGWGERWDASAGSFYALYKFDPFAGSERDDVRTYYAALSYRPSAATITSLRYELEREDTGDFHTLRWGMSWRF